MEARFSRKRNPLFAWVVLALLTWPAVMMAQEPLRPLASWHVPVGIARVADYLRAQTKAGVLAVEDCEIAASQFMEACKATLVLPVLFNFAEAPAPERIEHVVGIAVKTFLAAYRAR